MNYQIDISLDPFTFFPRGGFKDFMNRIRVFRYNFFFRYQITKYFPQNYTF